MWNPPRLWRASVLVRLAWLAFAAISCSAEPASELEVGKLSEALFANGSFESGSANAAPPGWTVTGYKNDSSGGVTRETPQSREKLNLSGPYTTAAAAQTVTVYSAAGPESQPDAVLGTGAELRWPKYGNYAAWVNMNLGKDTWANSLSQNMTLGVNDVDPYDGKPHVRFVIAPVLENPLSSHTDATRPYYFVQLRNVTTNTVLFREYNASSDTGIPWKTVGDRVYTNWALKDISPTSTQAALGDEVELEILAAGCQPGGHWGRVYVDGVGAKIPGLAVKASAASKANANSFLPYDLVFNNGGTGAAGNVVVEFTPPTKTTFSSLSAPGALCTQPAVGATTKITCTYGLLEPGATDSLRVTVLIDQNANGIVQAGNYQISANNASALLGSTVFTELKQGVTFADVAVTNTNSVGAVSWGQALVYTITASNKGPANLSNGTLTDTLPATLTNATWTCAGSNGGSCAASGSGHIHDSTVTLPVGASVTYTLSTTLASSGADTRLRNVATFTHPGTSEDPQSDDNGAADVDPITTTSTLSSSKAGNATGTVVSVPSAIDCGPGCTSRSATFARNADLILAATPASGKIFTGWSGACTGTGTCAINLTADASVTATFDSPPACTKDSECSSTRYCDGVSLTCQPRLANGVSVPNDGLHAGTCATMGLACSSLVCNANKCAKSGGASCTTAAECGSNSCTSSVCGKTANDTACGQNGDCTSGSCKSYRCVPAANGCYQDLDCSSTQYCRRSTLTCVNKLDKGAAIPSSDGLHTGTCSDAAAVCLSGYCNSTTITCGVSDGASCTVPSDCRNNTCLGAHCVPASNGCYSDDHCSAGNYCNRSALSCTATLSVGTPIPVDGLHAGSCNDAAAVCQTGLCNLNKTSCAADNGNACSDAASCVSDQCTGGYCVSSSAGCYVDSDCGAGSFCDRAQFSCVAKLVSGTLLPSDGLHTGVCGDAPAVCLDGGCNEAAHSCASSNGAGCTGVRGCVSNSCQSDHCVPAADGCWLDLDCSAGKYCDRQRLSCVPTLDPGSAIPSDGLHDGSCDHAQDVCTSRLCNSMTSTCAVASSAACTAPSQCVSNTCTSDHCVPTANGCFVDRDCSGDNYCDRVNLVCAPKLPAGTAIPNDALHMGSCSAAPAVCISGECNEATRSCAVGAGLPCAGAAECTTNTCTSQHCVPAANGCYADADCSDTDYCAHDSLTCSTKLDPGRAIPDDGLHGGTCADASATCKSPLCNVQASTCGRRELQRSRAVRAQHLHEPALRAGEPRLLARQRLQRRRILRSRQPDVPAPSRSWQRHPQRRLAPRRV
jgi:uncharacterized repeat protein (TIGR01451 family)